MKQIILSLFIAFQFITYGQEGYTMKANYSTCFQLSNRDYLKVGSFAGFGFGIGKMYDTGFSLSIDANWNYFYQKQDRSTYYFEGGAVTTNLVKYRSHIPVVLALDYTFLRDRFFKLKPRVGLGVGFNYIRDEILFSTYDLKSSSYGFLLQPKVGASIALDEEGDLNLFLDGLLNYSTNRNTDFNYKSNTSVNVCLGLYLILE